MGTLEKPDYLVIGAGVVGLTLARALAAARPGAKIVVLEKESGPGAHASGRNSGVVHAGIYYTPGSLKARLCVEGARRLLDYCRQARLPLRETGKVIVPSTKGDEQRLLALHRNGLANGVALELIDGARLAELEPAAAKVERALYSPATASVDPNAVLERLVGDLDDRGVTVTFGVGVTAIDAETKSVRLSTGGTLSYGYLVNAAGTHAERLAHSVGVGLRYTQLPFRGAYFELSPDSGIALKRQIYPVPDPDLPFLGVHLTVACSGKVYVGPSARPVWGREHYQGLSGVDWGGLPKNLGLQLALFATNRGGYRRHAMTEIRRMALGHFLAEARHLAPAIEARHLKRSSKSGIRAQLYDKEAKTLVMDFVVEEGRSSLHVLNAVSPGFTASFAFADYLVGLVDG